MAVLYIGLTIITYLVKVIEILFCDLIASTVLHPVLRALSGQATSCSESSKRGLILPTSCQFYWFYSMSVLKIAKDANDILDYLRQPSTMEKTTI